jgi:hypothetical protein
MQLGGSHDHPIDLHLCSGSAAGVDFDLAGVPQSKQLEPHRQPKHGRRREADVKDQPADSRL